MYVSDYISYLVNGEIKQLAVSDIGGETPTATQLKNIEAIISYINLANLELHKKYGLIQQEFVLEDVTPNTLYSLPVDFLHAIGASYRDGTEIPLNNEKTKIVDNVDYNVSLMFPAPFKVLVKGTDEDERDDISLVYAAAPAKVTKTKDFIDLPQVYTEALLNYAAYKAHLAVKGDSQSENNVYYLRFRESCKNIEMLGLLNSDNQDSNTKLTDRGFV